jgi:hypothetical protein
MKIDTRDIFEQIGNVFYAVATDQRIKKIEQGELKGLIAKDWLPRHLSTDGFVSNEAHFIIMTMDANAGEQVSAPDAFNEFSKFYLKHKEVFSTELIKRIVDTAIEITDVFKADNLNENIHLRNLKELFNLVNEASGSNS